MKRTLGLLLGLVLQVRPECQVQNSISNLVTLELGVEDRVDCHPDPWASPEVCQQRGCVWAPPEYEDKEGVEGPPWCFYPAGYGYSMLGEPVETENGFLVHLTRTASSGSMFGGEVSDIWLQLEMQTEERLRIKISDDKPRFEVPIQIPSGESRPANPLYEVSFTESPTLGIRVTRRDSGEPVLETSLPGLVFSDQFLQLPIRLPHNSSLYGWGENEQHSLAHNMNWKRWGLYGRDQPPDGSSNMYGVHPRVTILDRNGAASGLLFLNSAAQEISLTPAPSLIYRTIGGLLDIYVFLGPGPEQVVQQFTQAVGRFPIPPYWSLGFHLCRYGYNKLENMVAAVERTKEYKIPQDAQWGDIDIMERSLDFTVDKDRFGGLSTYVDELKTQGVKFVTILDPCISIGEPNCTYRPYDLGQLYDVWVKRADGSPVVGRVWPEDPVHFPDYTNPRTHLWWSLLISEFHDLLAFDGLWIDMNEPSNFVTGDSEQSCDANTVNHPPYVPGVRLDNAGDGLAEKTLCGDARHSLGNHYDVHNMFGWSQSQPTLSGVRKATGQRGLVLSRSTFIGSGNWVAHWLGDNFSNWQNLRYSIIGMLKFNQFGIPLVGADICGFIGNTTAELCARWHQLGAFYPFSRNHNSIGSMEQDPGVFGDKVANIAKEALRTRYSMLPYLYTLFYQHQVSGGTVARPLWHEFPQDPMTRTIDDQFLWGPSFLVSPVLDEGATTRSLYLPPSARWFKLTNFFNSSLWVEEVGGEQTVSAPLEVLPLHLRGGSILPLQLPGLTTQQSRKNNFELLLALDSSQRAVGSLFYDDGESIDTLEAGEYFLGHMELNNRKLVMMVKNDGLAEMQFLIVSRVVILGIDLEDVTEVFVNGEPISWWDYSSVGLIITNLEISVNDNFEIFYE